MNVATIEQLEAIYGKPGQASLVKVADHITLEYRAWIEASKFCVLSTVGPEGADGSPRGDDGCVVTEMDSKTLLMPDWRGNNRMDSLRNIVRDGRVALMFMVPGKTNVIRVNGTAVVSVDRELIDRFQTERAAPRSVIVITIDEIYSQCARALMRSGLWTGNDDRDLPSMGDILRAQTQGEINGKAYDDEWPGRAAKTMW